MYLGHPKLSGHKFTESKARLTAGRNTQTARTASESLCVTLGRLTTVTDQQAGNEVQLLDNFLLQMFDIEF
jgi:hypothetical protein